MNLPFEIVSKILDFLEWYEQIPLRRVNRNFNYTILNYRDIEWTKHRQILLDSQNTDKVFSNNHRGYQTIACHSFSEEEKDSFLFSRLIWCDDENIREKLLIHWKGRCNIHHHYFNTLLYSPSDIGGNYYAFLRDFKTKNPWNLKKEKDLLEKKKTLLQLEREIREMEIIRKINQ